MECIGEKEGEVTMYKRTLKTLAVALVLGVGISAQAAFGMPREDGGAVVVQKSQPALVSEKVAGLDLAVPTTEYAVVSEKTAGLNLEPQSPLVGYSDRPIVSEKTAGLQLSSQPELAAVEAPAPGFDWSDAGIGAGFTSLLILAALWTTLMVRRHHQHGAFSH
jgi:hypothetical protein